MTKHTMRAAEYSSGKVWVRNNYPKPELSDFTAKKKYSDGLVRSPKTKNALIRVEAASICGTDLHVLEGSHPSKPPVVLGHEYVGTVVEIGSDVLRLERGDTVAVDPNIKCGECFYCLRGMPNMCSEMTTLGIFCDGGFAEYNLLPAKQLYRLPDDTPVERAIFFEPVTCVLHGLNKLDVKDNDRVLVMGAGPIGCYFAMICGLVAKVYVVEPNPFRQNVARRINVTSLRKTADLENESFDVVIDAAGVPQVIPEAIRLARCGGKILLFGQQNIHARVEINPTTVNQKELSVYGSYITSDSFAEAVKTITDPRLDFPSLITHRFGLNEIAAAFEAMRSGTAMEVLISVR